MFDQKAKNEVELTAKRQITYDELTKDIQDKEEKKHMVQKTLKQKEIELYKKKFAIEELQKTKHVLAHRTQEMKASLEPKE